MTGNLHQEWRLRRFGLLDWLIYKRKVLRDFISKKSPRKASHFFFFAVIVGLPQYYGYYYYKRCFHSTYLSFWLPFLCVLVLSLILLIQLVLEEWRNRHKEELMPGYLEIPPLDTSLVTFIVSTILACYLAGYTIFDGGRFGTNEVYISGDLIDIEKHSNEDIIATFSGRLMMTDKEPKQLRGQAFNGFLEKKKSAVKGTVKVKQGLLMEDYIFSISFGISDDWEPKIDERIYVDSKNHPQSPKSAFFLIWLLFETFVFAWVCAVVLRSMLIFRYKISELTPPPQLTHKKEKVRLARAIDPPEQEKVASLMIEKITKPKYGPFWQDKVTYPPDVFALEIIVGEKYVPMSFVNVWTHQSDLCCNSDRLSLTRPEAWPGRNDLKWRTKMKDALRRACQTAKKKVGNQSHAQIKESLFSTAQADLIEPLGSITGLLIE